METGNWKLETGDSRVKKTLDFEDLEVWQKAIELAVEIYKLTKYFPKEEMYALTNQIRRAASSISANIAEGYGRHHYKEKTQFYKIANGSLLETKSFCHLAVRLDYVKQADFDALLPLFTSNHKLLNALIRSLKEKYEA